MISRHPILANAKHELQYKLATVSLALVLLQVFCILSLR